MPEQNPSPPPSPEESDDRRDEAPRARAPWVELGALMLRLGATAFGGPAAHVAMLEDEVVRRRGWLSAQEFLDLLGASNLIPGPSSTEMMMHTGARRLGVPGLWLAGICFMTPAVLITLGFAWVYVRFGTLPAGQGVLAGIKPAVVALIFVALWKLGRTAARNRALALLALAVFALYRLGASEIALLLAAGAAGIALMWAARPGRAPLACWIGPAALAAPSGLATPVAAGAASPLAVGLYFLKIGSVLFGSGYVLLAFLQQGLVERLGWLTPQQLVDAVAVGQFTPGPLFSTATFIGYLIAGVPGAVAATVGIFLPSFFLVWATHPLVPRLRRSPWAAGFLDGVNAGSVGLMAGVLLQMGLETLHAWPAWLIAALSLAVMLRTRLNTAWVVLGGAVLGLLFQFILPDP